MLSLNKLWHSRLLMCNRETSRQYIATIMVSLFKKEQRVRGRVIWINPYPINCSSLLKEWSYRVLVAFTCSSPWYVQLGKREDSKRTCQEFAFAVIPPLAMDIVTEPNKCCNKPRTLLLWAWRVGGRRLGCEGGHGDKLMTLYWLLPVLLRFCAPKTARNKSPFNGC